MRIKYFGEYAKINETSMYSDIIGFDTWRKLSSINESSESDSREKVSKMSDKDSMETAQKIVQLCKLKIVNHFEGFKPFLDIMPPIAQHGAGSVGADGIGTMSTNGHQIFYDPRFVVASYEQAKVDFASLAKDNAAMKRGALDANIKGTQWFSDYACFVIVHEIMHNSLKHFMRTRTEVTSKYLDARQIHYLWNIAQDYEINRILKNEMKGTITIWPGGVDWQEGPFKAPKGEEDFFSKATSERIFWRLFRNVEDKKRIEAGDEEEEEEDEMSGYGSGDDEGEGEGESSEGGEEGSEGEEEGSEGEAEGEGEGSGSGGEGSEEGEGREGESSGGEGESGEGEGSEGGGGGESGEGSGNDGDGNQTLKIGDIIQDGETGEYGRVTGIQGEDVDWNPISKEEARRSI
tara:strand:- start:175 stop:1389 length:1215 start_codon:yes stop_codon:yes gene_type:complete